MPSNLPHVIGVDIGTTSTKAVVFDLEGKVKGHHTAYYPLLTPAPGVAEQDPEEIFRATLAAIRGGVHAAGLAPADIKGVGFSAAMHSVIAVDDDGKPLTRSITWADTRAAAYADLILRDMDGHGIYLRTGTPIHPMSPLVKLLWLRKERGNVFREAVRFVGIKEYIFYRLFGRWLVDYSIASATGLFNLQKLDWDEGALAVAGITSDHLSKPAPPTHHVEGLDTATAADLGLPPGI
ncbi:MAG: FGGY family carbohydrate kinase, partial [Rhodospirillales bacterium]